MSRWLVSADHSVEPDDLGSDGLVSDTTLLGWAEAAVESYLDHCPLLHQRVADGQRLVRNFRRFPSAAVLGRPTGVLVTASATEFRPAEFTVSVRVRPGGGEVETPVNLSCVVRLEDAAGEAVELGTEVRDELIALEHSAAHFN
jgi:acyl-CoA thioesterase FadM